MLHAANVLEQLIWGNNMRHFCEVEAVVYISKQSLNYQSFSDAVPSLRFLTVSGLFLNLIIL